jgi:hypothetical protein
MGDLLNPIWLSIAILLLTKTINSKPFRSLHGLTNEQINP